MEINGSSKRKHAGRGGRFEAWLWAGLTCLPTVVLPGGAWSPAQADEPLAVSSSYGSGVHAYFDGNYQAAYDALTAAIEAGTLDPRAYYYRGLASIKLGKIDDEINGDFAEGASRETVGRGGISVSRSLERVQGRDRQRLEQYRRRARVAAVQRDEAAIRTPRGLREATRARRHARGPVPRSVRYRCDAGAGTRPTGASCRYLPSGSRYRRLR